MTHGASVLWDETSRAEIVGWYKSALPPPYDPDRGDNAERNEAARDLQPLHPHQNRPDTGVREQAFLSVVVAIERITHSVFSLAYSQSRGPSKKNILVAPMPLISVEPRSSNENASFVRSRNVSVTWMRPGTP